MGLDDCALYWLFLLIVICVSLLLLDLRLVCALLIVGGGLCWLLLGLGFVIGSVGFGFCLLFDYRLWGVVWY